MKCSYKFVRPAVIAACQKDENPNPSVVAETIKLLANKSYGCQDMDRSRPSVTRYMNKDKTYAAINSKMFKRLGHINDQLREVLLTNSETEHIETGMVGFFILQNAS